jgi:hypothetical protein
MLLNFGALRQYNYALYHRVSTAFKHTSGVYPVDASQLNQEDRAALVQFEAAYEQQREIEKVERKRKEAEQQQREADEQQRAADERQRKLDAEKQAELEATEHQRQIDADKEANVAAYKARLLQYLDAGLEPSTANANAIRVWIDSNISKDHVSVGALNAAISNLGVRGTNVLTWKPKVEPPAPAPPPPPPVLLADGSEQLPLDAAPTYKHTKAQLADLMRRQVAEEQARRRKGWHGVSI